MTEYDICRSLILGHVSVAKDLFIRNGIDVNSILPCGLRPLTIAIKLRSVDGIRMLLSLGADVDRPASTENTNSIIFNAYWETAEFEHPGELGLLLDAGMPIDRLDGDGMTLLMHAVARYVWTTRFLLEKGADPNIKGRDDMTSLMYALETDVVAVAGDNLLEIVKMLLSCGADLSSRNVAGENASDILRRQRYEHKGRKQLEKLFEL